MLYCYNRGCGETYDPEDNAEDSCQHHPGAPFFHDSYKGWSCCRKKSVDFTEFLNIAGCTFSRHSNIKAPKIEEETKKILPYDPDDLGKGTYARPFVPMPRPTNPSSMIRVEPTVQASLKKAIDDYDEEEPKTDRETLAKGEIPVGTICKNSGCRYSYAGTEADHKECEYHSGIPIFHEGMKYWSCCQKKTTDFTVFMAQKGCCSGIHKWFKEIANKNVVQCRHDWHQTAKKLIVTIYAKMYHYEDSFVEVNPIHLHVNLVFPAMENRCFDFHLELFHIIEPTKTTVEMYLTKVEIVMIKKESFSWSALEYKPKELTSSDDEDEPGEPGWFKKNRDKRRRKEEQARGVSQAKFADKAKDEPDSKNGMSDADKAKDEPVTKNKSPDVQKSKEDPETEKELYVSKKVKDELDAKKSKEKPETEKELSASKEVKDESHTKNGASNNKKENVDSKTKKELPDTDEAKDGPVTKSESPDAKTAEHEPETEKDSPVAKKAKEDLEKKNGCADVKNEPQTKKEVSNGKKAKGEPQSKNGVSDAAKAKPDPQTKKKLPIAKRVKSEHETYKEKTTNSDSDNSGELDDIVVEVQGFQLSELGTGKRKTSD